MSAFAARKCCRANFYAQDKYFPAFLCTALQIGHQYIYSSPDYAKKGILNTQRYSVVQKENYRASYFGELNPL